MKLTPRSLLGRTAVTISLTLVLFMVISLGAAVYFIAIPMAERSADDFAAVIVSAAQTLESSPRELHEDRKGDQCCRPRPERQEASNPEQEQRKAQQEKG